MIRNKDAFDAYLSTQDIPMFWSFSPHAPRVIGYHPAKRPRLAALTHCVARWLYRASDVVEGVSGWLEMKAYDTGARANAWDKRPIYDPAAFPTSITFGDSQAPPDGERD
ncbi:MAG: hypothetical protein M3Q71_14990 [Chloroflexota bacterium]|nr:hypothetical protein [Chloroflexota bacterium]